MASSDGAVSSEPTTDLATLISKGTVDEEVLKLYAEKGLLDIPDEDGKTPLMYACLAGLEDVVKFLLENGANPNSKSQKEGNTPLHYACTVERPWDLIPAYKRWKISPRKYEGNDARSRVPIVKLLLRYGAKAVENSHGWSPPCVAAFHLLKDVVDFFLAMDDDEVPLKEKIKAAELLGVSTALSHDDPECEDMYHQFSRAIIFNQQGAGLPPAQPVTSELAARFSKVSWKECQTEEELESIKRWENGLKAHAFLIGDRLYPQILKQRYLYPAFLIFASDLFDPAEFEGDGQDFFQAMSFAICLERQGDLKLGSVANIIAGNLYEISDGEFSECPDAEDPGDQCLKNVRKLLCEYESVLQHAHIDSLSANVDSIIKSFGYILFCAACRCSDTPRVIIRSILLAVEKSVRIIRSRIRRETPGKINEISSVAYEIMSRLPHDNYDNIDLESLLRARYVLLKTLYWDSASYTNSDGNTLLHLAAKCARSAAESMSSLDPDYPHISNYIKDFIRAFIRHGCPISAVNAKGKTAKEVFEDDDELPDEESGFPLLLSPPTSTTVFTLEEIAIRTILRHNIVYQETLPPCLCEMIDGGLNDSDLKSYIEREGPDSESESKDSS